MLAARRVEWHKKGVRWSALLIISLACRPSLPHSPSAPGIDPYVVALDADSPSALVLVEGDSLILDRGWTPEHRVARVGTNDPAAADRRVWALGGTSRLRFVKPPGPVDFWLRGQAFPPGSTEEMKGEPQSVRIVLDGETVAERTLAHADWQDLRVELPEDLDTGRLHELALEWSRGTRPQDHYGEGEDRRLLAAEVTGLAVIPRGLATPEESLQATYWSSGSRLVLPLGAAVAVPLPRRSRGWFRWGAVDGPVGATITLHRQDSTGSETPLWDGTVREASALEQRWESRDAGSRLILRAAGAQRTYDAKQKVSIEWFEDALRFESEGTQRRESSSLPEVPLAIAPPVFVYMVDTLRADALGPYGAPPERTPAIDRFASEAVVYERAQAASAWTLPSVVSLLTGTYPDRHGVMKGFEKLAARLPLASRLETIGYDTVAFSQSFIASEAFGVDQGFGEFWLSDQLNDFGQASPQLRRMFQEWYRSRTDQRPFFAYLHSVDPHAPYAPKPPFDRLANQRPGSLDPKEYGPGFFNLAQRADETQEVAHLRALYDGEVQFVDLQFGQFVALLRQLGLYDEALIVLVSDHGEEFGEHGGFDHGRTLYREMIEVPLLVKYPGEQWAGQRVASPVSLVDLAATIYRVAGVTPPSGAFDGPSLTAPLEAEASPLEGGAGSGRVVLSLVNPEAGPYGASVDYESLIGESFKCIHDRLGTDQFGQKAAPWEVFDLQRDAMEQSPLAAEGPLALRCRGALDRWRERRSATLSEPASGDTVDAEAIETLKALGYIQ